MNEKFNIYIGLLKSNMQTQINKDYALNLISDKLIKIGVIGFNVENIKGFWNGKPENCLKISFINTFNINMKILFKTINKLKISLEQESILIEQEKLIKYQFV